METGGIRMNSTFKKAVIIILVIIVTCSIALAKKDIEPKPTGNITLVYFAASDCSYCDQWAAFDKPKLLASEEIKHIEFRTIQRPFFKYKTDVDQYPDDLKWLYKMAKTGKVPAFIVLIDKTILLQSSGTNNWDNKVFPFLKELVAKKKAERDTVPVGSETILK
jgi:thiol-disulfide isomerase/thioredoxin